MPEYKSEYITDEGLRFYIDKEDKEYISTTSLLSLYEDKSGLDAWRNRIGREAADKIGKDAADFGTLTHKQIEDYYGGLCTEQDLNEFAVAAINAFYKHVGIISLEEQVFYEHVAPARFSGRADQILSVPPNTFKIRNSYDYIPACNVIGDLKTKANRLPRTDIVDYVLKYCLQLSAYAKALSFKKNIPITGAILVFVKKSTTKLLYIDSEKIDAYWNIFLSLLDDYFEVAKTSWSWNKIIKYSNLRYCKTDHIFKSLMPVEFYV